ncbi:MAG: GNAT family N-acetyltransferase, partial [Planctomycetes bacterium]|nr:GNAT family N-acetyltransferase [Planctomycetota bacterium]
MRTDRLVLSRFASEDAATLFAYRSDPDVNRYHGWVPANLEEVVAFVGEQRVLAFDTPGTWFQLAMRERDGSDLVGDVGVRFPDPDTRQVEIGVTVMPAAQQRGYAAEAVNGLLGFLFETCGKHRVFASVDPRNAASIALLRRVGFRQEAHFRESLWIRGE